MNETGTHRISVLGRAVLAGACCCALLSGCATTYRICLPQAAECSTVKSYRKIAELKLEVTLDGGVSVTMADVDRQSAGPLEQAAADVIRSQIPR